MEQPPWAAFHFHYHADLDLPVREIVGRALPKLLAAGEVESFFYVRYGLGGPHVRLRVRAGPGRAEAVEAVLAEAAADLFARTPSRASLDEDAIRRSNRRLLDSDPNEDDPAVYPDNFWRRAPYRPEIGRYGGPERFEASLGFFAVSSVRCLAELADGDAGPRRRLDRGFRLLARHLLGFAQDGEEMLALAGRLARRGGVQELAEARGDELFARRGEALTGALGREAAAILEPSTRPPLAAAARALAWELRAADPETRWRVFTSQMHMSANRLGLRPVEEVYLARLLGRAFAELAAQEPELLARLRSWFARCATTPPEPAERLEELVATALADLAWTGGGLVHART